jgi:hypothetical protein
MKKLSLALLASIVVLFCCAPAFAGNEISLGSSTGAPIKFIGTGNPGAHNFNVTFNINNLLATGFGSLASTGFYSITNSGSNVFSNGSCGTGCFMLGESGPLAFKYGSGPGGSDLLTGNLYFTDIVQSAMGGGIFNDSLVINFVVTGGSLAGAFATSNGIVTLQIKFTTNQDLSTILNGQTLMAKVVGGAVFPIPEPASLALMGAGLVGIAGLGRKKLLPNKTVSQSLTA